jgi:hypothetical protein
MAIENVQFSDLLLDKMDVASPSREDAATALSRFDSLPGAPAMMDGPPSPRTCPHEIAHLQSLASYFALPLPGTAARLT